MRILQVFAALLLSTAAYAQLVIGNDLPFQVNYATNLAYGDSFVTVTNSGAAATVSMPLQNGNICVNVYTYDPTEELVACCSCPLTPNALEFLSVKRDLIINTLTPAMPPSVVVKLLANVATTCNAATVTSASLTRGLIAWGTTMAQTSAGVYTPERTPFTSATLSTAELTRMTSLCGFIEANGSGYGICNPCRTGSSGGASRQQ